MGTYVNEVIDSVSKSYSWEREFLQALREVPIEGEAVRL